MRWWLLSWTGEKSFKVNQTKSTPRLVKGGSPQRTKLGNFLFIITIEEIELDRIDDIVPHICPEPEEYYDDEDSLDLRRLAGRIGALRRFDSGVRIASTPTKIDTTDEVLRYFDTSCRSDDPCSQTEMPPPEDYGAWADKYVDNLNAGEKLLLDSAVSHLSSQKEERRIRAYGCEELFKTVSSNSAILGMLVNDSKTQMICISPSIHYDVKSYIETTDGASIESGESLSILGFSFSPKPDASAHVALILKKFAARSWMIRHLHAGGVDKTTLVAVYCSVVRSVIEYAVPVYHHLLNLDQSSKLERLQRQVMKVILGHNTSYEDALEEAKLETLAKRRETIVEKFTLKLSNNERFNRWFPLRDQPSYNLRRRTKYEETFARTDRLKKNPVNHMRNILNNRP